MKKYNVFNNAKQLVALMPNKNEISVLLITLFIGLYFYQYHQEAEAILGFASSIILFIIGHIIGWFIMFSIHAVICYKRNVNFYGKSKDDLDEK